MSVDTELPARRRRGLFAGAEDRRVLTAELMDELRHYAQTMTEFAARLGGRLVNNVLAVETCIVDAVATPVAREWGVAAGCVEVSNLSDANTLTVVAAGAGAAAPASGMGVYRVRPNTTRVVAVASRQVTFYGTAGDVFCYQAFTAAPQPAVI